MTRYLTDFLHSSFFILHSLHSSFFILFILHSSFFIREVLLLGDRGDRQDPFGRFFDQVVNHSVEVAGFFINPQLAVGA